VLVGPRPGRPPPGGLSPAGWAQPACSPCVCPTRSNGSGPQVTSESVRAARVTVSLPALSVPADSEVARSSLATRVSLVAAASSSWRRTVTSRKVSIE
jgi:hypothetical protein